MYTDINSCLPFSLTYSDESCIASYGHYGSRKAASDASIEAVKKNPHLLLSNFYISENKPVEHPFTETLATYSVKKYKVYVKTPSLTFTDFIGEYNSKEDANAAIIDDITNKHPGYTIDQYFISEENQNFV